MEKMSNFIGKWDIKVLIASTKKINMKQEQTFIEISKFLKH